MVYTPNNLWNISNHSVFVVPYVFWVHPTKYGSRALVSYNYAIFYGNRTIDLYHQSKNPYR